MPRLGGRQKGTPNKKTAETRARIAKVLRMIEKEHLEDDIKTLSASQRTTFYADLLEYAIPKLARVEHEGGTDDTLTVRIVRSNNKT